jgi:hypothetical protein
VRVLRCDDVHAVNLPFTCGTKEGSPCALRKEKWAEEENTTTRTCSPGILSPCKKYSVLNEEHSADVPMPHSLFW